MTPILQTDVKRIIIVGAQICLHGLRTNGRRQLRQIFRGGEPARQAVGAECGVEVENLEVSKGACGDAVAEEDGFVGIAGVAGAAETGGWVPDG